MRRPGIIGLLGSLLCLGGIGYGWLFQDVRGAAIASVVGLIMIVGDRLFQNNRTIRDLTLSRRKSLLIRTRLHAFAIIFIMVLLGAAILLWTTNTYRSNLRDELISRSSSHELLVPAYLDCRSGWFDETPVGNCLAETSDLADKLGLSDDWELIRHDILGYEEQPKNGITLMFSMLSDGG